MNLLNKYPIRKQNTPWRELDKEIVIVSPQGGMIHILNRTASEIWKLADGTHTIENIIQKIYEHFEVSIEQAEIDVKHFIEDLEIKQLITFKDEIGDK